MVVDDSGVDRPIPDCFNNPRVTVHRLPFDTGLSRKRNFGMVMCDTPYVFLLDDDVTVNLLDLDQLINELGDFDFLCPANGLKASIFYGEDGYYWTETSHGEKDGKPLYHFVENYLFGKTQTFLDRPWCEELHCGEHLPWAYMAFANRVNITTSEAIQCVNRATPGSDLYKALRWRAEFFRKDWFQRNTEQIDLPRRA